MEDQNEKESKTSANLLYPELMSQDELIAVLKQVCLFVLQSFLYFNQRILLAPDIVELDTPEAFKARIVSL